MVRGGFCLPSWWWFRSIWRGARNWRQSFLLLWFGLRTNKHIFLCHARAVNRLSSVTDGVWKRLDQCHHSSFRCAFAVRISGCSRVGGASRHCLPIGFYFAAHGRTNCQLLIFFHEGLLPSKRLFILTWDCATRVCSALVKQELIWELRRALPPK